MSALVPYNSRGYPSQIHFESHKRKNNQRYDKRFMEQQSYIPPLYPTLPIYQASFYSTHRYPMTGHNQFGRSTMSTDLISLNQSNKQHRYAQYMRHIGDMKKYYWKQKANTMPLPRHGDSFPAYNRPNIVYEYEKETRYIPYFVYPSQGISGFGNSRNLGYGYLSNSGYSTGFNNNIANIGRTRKFPPKVRVIFMPTGSPSSQQPCTGALAMPPFTFNRMSQPLCSLPLPPPLPQIASLPLTPVVQQMVMKQYANPVAVLPFTQNWPISQPIISGFPQVSQSYIPSTQLPANVPALPSNVAPYEFFFNATSSRSQYSNSGYPSTCRACVPPPPSLNVPVTGHCWTQHCSACHHIPTDTAKPNARPTNGRSTPLLRHPTIVQNAYNLPVQQQQYPHINASARTRSWSHKMPPLPQGAVIISDQYIPRKDTSKTNNFSRKYPVQRPYIPYSEARSISLSSNSTSTDNSNKISSEKKSKKKYEGDKSQPTSKSSSNTPLSQSGISNAHHVSTSALSSSPSNSFHTELAAKEHQKIDINQQNSEQNLPRKELTTAAHNINLRYNYQKPDLVSVYHNNRYLKSNDTDSTSLSSSVSSPNIFITKEYKHGRPPLPINLGSRIEEEDDKKSIQTLSNTSFQSKQPVTTTIIIRKLAASSPSTITSVLRNLSLDLTENDVDSISLISIGTLDQADESDSVISETF